MKKLKASEIGELIGKSRQYVNRMRSLGKIIADDKNMFDVDNPINKDWINRMREKYIAENKKVERKQPKKVKTAKNPEPINTNPGSPPPDQPENENAEEAETEELTFAELKARADLRIKELSIEEKTIELKKRSGELINFEVVNNATMAYMSMFKKSLQRDIETLLHKFCDVHGISLKEKTKYVNELIPIMNNASERTMIDLKNKIQSENEAINK